MVSGMTTLEMGNELSQLSSGCNDGDTANCLADGEN